MKPAVRWTALAALALILVMVAGAAVATFGLDALRPVVVRNLSEAIDRPVSIEGDLGLGWDQGPVLTAAGITVAGAQNTPPLLEAGRVELCLAGDAVLGGRLVITALALSDVVVRPGSYGGTSRTRLHEPEPSAPVDLSVLGPDARLDLTDVTVLTGGNAPP